MYLLRKTKSTIFEIVTTVQTNFAARDVRMIGVRIRWKYFLQTEAVGKKTTNRSEIDTRKFLAMLRF